MNIQDITYGKTFTSPDEKEWEKIGIRVRLDDDSELNKATELAKAYVEDTRTKEFIPVIGSEEIVISHIDKEWEQVREKLEAIEFREDAEEYAKLTGFQYSVSAKTIINSKPSKL